MTGQGVEACHRKLAAILIADAVGYSRLMAKDEEGVLSALKSSRALIDPLIAKYDGRVFGGAGDSVVAEFPSAVGALRCAIAIQEALAAPSGDGAGTQAMQFRIGINLGDVMVDGENLFGDGVNVTERLQTVAPPGGICISGSVHEQVRDRFPLTFIDLGQQQVKNIPHPVHAYCVAPAGAAEAFAKGGQGALLLRLRSNRFAAAVIASFLLLAAVASYSLWETGNLGSADPTSMQPEPSGPPIIAVLPFSNLSGDSSQDYFSDGLTEDIISALGRFSNVAVTSRNAVFSFKGQPVGPNEIRETLNARYVLEGSVRKSGDRVRVGAQLTDTMRNLLIWSAQYDRQLSDIFQLQDEITRNIVGTLAIRITRIEEERAFGSPTENLNAYDYLLRGRALMARRERSDNFKARELFEQAIKIDARYAEAHAALGWTYYIEATYGWVEFIADSLERAEESALTAMNLNPELAEPHQLLGFIHLARKEYERARRQIERAIELNPNDAYSYATAGGILLWIGEAEEVIRMIELAKRIDPMLWEEYHYILGLAHYLTGDYDAAIRVLEPVAGRVRDHLGFAGLAASYAMLGRGAEAAEATREVKRRWPFFTVEEFTDQWADAAAKRKVAEGLRKAGLK